MKIALQTTSLAPSGGIELMTFQLGRALAGRGHVVDIVGMAEGSLSGDYGSFAHGIHLLGAFSRSPFSLHDVEHPIELARWLGTVLPAVRATRRLRPDVVYAQMITALPWALGASLATRSEVVCHLHAICRTDMSRQARLWARGVRAFVVPSEASFRSWTAHGLPAEPHVVPQGIDPGAYPPTNEQGRLSARRALGLDTDGFVVLFYGRLEESKGVNVLLGAWHRLDMPPDAAELLLVGPAPRSFAAWAPGRPGLRYLEMRRDVLTPLHAADLVVVPSLEPEGFGRVVIEAMAAGVPVVASHVGALPEILTGRFADGLFPPGDEEALADRIRSFADWRVRDPSLGQECTDYVAENYGLERMVDRIETILNPDR